MSIPSYIQHLSKDKKIKKLIADFGEIKIKTNKNIFNALCASILSQQLSVKVADMIYKRFLDLFEGRKPNAQEVLSKTKEQYRAIGFSNAKVAYIQNVARFDIEYGLQHARISKMSNEEIIIYLTQIKGVGRWTVEMLLMFTLGREDVFAADDLGIKNAMIAIYNVNTQNKKKLQLALMEISDKWIPYRTYACMHLWRWKDNK